MHKAPSAIRNPEVSIIIPVYNDEECIGRAIKSALGQTLAAVEVVVVDDGSTDGTPDIIRQFEGRIISLRQDNCGTVAVVRNAGVAASHGRYLCFLDSDDTFLPERAEIQARFLDQHPDIGLCYGGWLEVDLESGDVLRDYSLARPDRRLVSDVFPPPFPVFAALVRRQWFERVGGFDERFKCVEDSVLWRRLWAEGCTFKRTKGAVACRGVRPESKSKNVPRHSTFAICAFRMHFARMGARVDRETRVWKLTGEWLRQAGYHFARGEDELVQNAFRQGFRYNPGMLCEPANWARLYAQLELSAPDGQITNVKRFPDLFVQLVEAALGAMGQSADRVAPRDRRAVKSALAYALSVQAYLKGNLLETLRWGIKALLVGRGKLPAGVDWPLIRRGLRRIRYRFASIVALGLRRLSRRIKPRGQRDND